MIKYIFILLVPLLFSACSTCLPTIFRFPVECFAPLNWEECGGKVCLDDTDFETYNDCREKAWEYYRALERVK